MVGLFVPVLTAVVVFAGLGLIGLAAYLAARAARSLLLEFA